jgi:hypothetical protein
LIGGTARGGTDAQLSEASRKKNRKKRESKQKERERKQKERESKQKAKLLVNRASSVFGIFLD